MPKRKQEEAPFVRECLEGIAEWTVTLRNERQLLEATRVAMHLWQQQGVGDRVDDTASIRIVVCAADSVAQNGCDESIPAKQDRCALGGDDVGHQVMNAIACQGQHAQQHLQKLIRTLRPML